MLSGTVLALALAAVGAGAEFLGTFVQPFGLAAPAPLERSEDKEEEPISLLYVSQTPHIQHTARVIPGDGQSYASIWLWAHVLLIWQFISTFTFAGIVKALCVTGNVLVQVSPFPQVRRWEQRGDTGGADSAPYVSIAFGGWQWCFYGVFAWLVTGRSGFLILLQSNSLGAVLGTYYTFAFYRQCQSEQARSSLHRYLSFVAGLAFFEACTTAVLPPQRALFLAGLVSAFCGFVSALSVLVVVPTVLRLRDSKSIPGPVVTASCLTNTLWTVCGLMLSDKLITLPSLAGLSANMVCVFLKQIYPSSEDSCQDCEMSSKEAKIFSDDFACTGAKCGPDGKDPCEPLPACHVTPTLRAQLRERMAERWRNALLPKPCEQTPLLKTPKAGLDSISKDPMDAEQAPPQAIHEDTGGTR